MLVAGLTCQALSLHSAEVAVQIQRTRIHSSHPEATLLDDAVQPSKHTSMTEKSDLKLTSEQVNITLRIHDCKWLHTDRPIANNYNKANRGRTSTNVQVGANLIFKALGKVDLLPAVQTAVELHQLIVEGQMLATLHVLRLICNNRGDLIPRLGTGTNQSQWQTMMYNCYSAVSHATGINCQKFSANKHPDLAETYLLYQQS